MNKKIAGISGIWFAWIALIAGLQVPNKVDPVDQKREDIILSMNAILNKRQISLVESNQCIITIFWKKNQLKAILVCDEKKIIEHNVNIGSNQDYVTQVINIDTLPNWSLNTHDGCFILESGWSQLIGWPDCEVNRIDSLDSQKIKTKLII